MSCCCIDIDDPATVLSEFIVSRARSPHFCGECNRCIPPGASYYKETVIYEGSISTHKTCLLCKSVRDDRMSCGFIWGEVWESVGECMKEYGEGDDDGWLDPPDFPIKVSA